MSRGFCMLPMAMLVVMAAAVMASGPAAAVQGGGERRERPRDLPAPRHPRSTGTSYSPVVCLGGELNPDDDEQWEQGK